MVLHLGAKGSCSEFLECVCEGVNGREKGSVLMGFFSLMQSPAHHESRMRRLGSLVGSVLDHAKNSL